MKLFPYLDMNTPNIELSGNITMLFPQFKVTEYLKHKLKLIFEDRYHIYYQMSG